MSEPVSESSLHILRIYANAAGGIFPARRGILREIPYGKGVYRLATAFFRTIILYLLLIAGLRLSGKRQIGELEPIELVLTLLSRYLPFLPKKEKEEQIITTSAIYNYVRMKLMPAPVKNKYNRIHFAYLIMICALMQSLSMSEIQKILPNGLTEDEVKKTYEAFVDQYTDSARVFVSMVESMAAQLLAAESADAADVNSFVLSTAVMTNFSRLLTTKLLELQNAPFTEEAVALWNPEE